jgi:hypothetical protein
VLLFNGLLCSNVGKNILSCMVSSTFFVGFFRRRAVLFIYAQSWERLRSWGLFILAQSSETLRSWGIEKMSLMSSVAVI